MRRILHYKWTYPIIMCSLLLIYILLWFIYSPDPTSSKIVYFGDKHSPQEVGELIGMELGYENPDYNIEVTVKVHRKE